MGCTGTKGKKIKSVESKQVTTSLMSLSIRKKSIFTRSMERKRSKYKELLDNQLKYSLEDFELITGILETREKNPSEKVEIRKVLMEHFLFNSLPIKSINALTRNFYLYNYEEGKTVFIQYSIGQYFYIINSGSVEIIINDITRSVLTKGECFGEIALLHDTLRTATVKTLEPTSLWVLSREAFKNAIHSVSKSKYSDNKSFLDNSPIFKILTPVQKLLMLDLLVSQDFKAGDRIIQENDPGDIFYIIKKGQVSCSIKNMEIRKLGPGEFFGEQALIYNTQRTATVKALSKLSVLSIGSEDLHDVLGSKFQDIIYRNSQRIALERSSVFKSLSPAQHEKCLHFIKVESFGQDEIVFRKGDIKGKKIYFVLKGEIRSEYNILNVFDCIGDIELRKGLGKYSENWVTTADTDLAVITREDVEKCIGGDLETTISFNDLISVLRRVNIFRAFSQEKLEGLIGYLKVVEFQAEEVIFHQGDDGESFFIVKEGQVEVFKDGVYLRMIAKDDFFGERSVMFNEPRTATVKAKIPTKCWTLGKGDFLNILDEPIQRQLTKRIELQNDGIGLSDLALVREIGCGTFGKVFLVYDVQKQVPYALKSISRWKINEYKIFDNVLLERQILLQLDHPMLMKLVKTFKDYHRVYFLCEFVKGIDLFDVMREIEQIDEEKSVFYISCLLLVLKFLHERHIVYRDLKPENVMIDEDGYPKLIDFGTAKIIKNRTFTVMGTPHYMAPEIIKGTGYGVEADLWSLGVMLYEFLFCSLPFADDEQDTFKIYKRIQEDPLRLPLPSTKFGCRSLLEKLLNKSPSMRGNCESVMKHGWFFGVNWDKFLAKQVKAPYIPDVSDPIGDLASVNVEGETLPDIRTQIYELENKEPIPEITKNQAPKDWDADF